MIRALVARVTTVLLTTQYLEEADRLTDEIVVIDHGRVIAAGTPQQLKTRVGGQVLQAQAADPTDLEATEKILSQFAREGESVHNDGQIVTVPIADRSALGQAVRALDEAGVRSTISRSPAGLDRCSSPSPGVAEDSPRRRTRTRTRR
jgi:ABC-type multidrug transport system ATPase subunit